MMLSSLSCIITTGVIWASFVVSSSTLCYRITRFGSRRSINSIVIIFGFFIRALYVLGSSKTQFLHSIRSSFPFAFAFSPSSSR
ncbi:hypothetical protein BKA61DRAFT_621172, partial [Leptodontidium sp. MPI-SDFR-AT-0119]